MDQKSLTLSLVIPAYNEERHLNACLKAVAAQTVPPLEVIVVDNNSTDKTAEIAKKYPFVTLISESVQGRGPARSAGFDKARGDIIGRIDADSVMEQRWVEKVLARFSVPDAPTGLTGLGRVDILPYLPSPRLTFWSRIYFWAVHSYFNVNTMWGANMAIRRDAWLRVRDRACLDDRIVHEDQDVSLLIIGEGGRIIQDNNLIISTHGQSYLYFPKVVRYALMRRHTRQLHRRLGTLKRPGVRLLGFWRTFPGRIYAYTAGIPFLMVSFLTWPIDEIYIRVIKRKPWLN